MRSREKIMIILSFCFLCFASCLLCMKNGRDGYGSGKHTAH